MSDLATGRQSAAVEGEFTPDRGLDLLLSGTNLEVHYTRPDAITIAPRHARAKDEPPADPLAKADLSIGELRIRAPDQAGGVAQDYSESVQLDIQSALRKDLKTRSGNYRTVLDLWIDFRAHHSTNRTAPVHGRGGSRCGGHGGASRTDDQSTAACKRFPAGSHCDRCEVTAMNINRAGTQKSATAASGDSGKDDPNAWWSKEVLRLIIAPTVATLLFASGVYWLQLQLHGGTTSREANGIVQVRLLPRPDPVPIPVAPAAQTAMVGQRRRGRSRLRTSVQVRLRICRKAQRLWSFAKPCCATSRATKSIPPAPNACGLAGRSVRFSQLAATVGCSASG